MGGHSVKPGSSPVWPLIDARRELQMRTLFIALRVILLAEAFLLFWFWGVLRIQALIATWELRYLRGR